MGVALPQIGELRCSRGKTLLRFHRIVGSGVCNLEKNTTFFSNAKCYLRSCGDGPWMYCRAIPEDTFARVHPAADLQ